MYICRVYRVWIIVSVYGKTHAGSSWRIYAYATRDRVGSFQGCPETERRAIVSASRPAVKAIEKRITTRHREAPALTMPVTCHHLFELCRRTRSFKLADTHPTSTHLHAAPLSSRPAMANEHHRMLDFGSNWLYSPTYNGPFRPLRTKYLCRWFVLPSYAGPRAVRVTIDLSYPKSEMSFSWMNCL